jgi:hypothetical protein
MGLGVSMSDLRKAAQALVNQWESNTAYPFGSLVDALRAALAQPEPIIPPEVKGNKTQPEQEPVAYQWLGTSVIRKRIPKTAEADAWQPLYTAPPQRKPLTDEEINKLWTQKLDDFCWIRLFARAIEKAHGIGGQP